MVEVNIQHIIGTVALMSLIISTSLFYMIITSSLEEDLRKKELAQISEIVASNIEEMINLAKFAKYTTDYMVKIIDLPIDLNGRAYQIQLIEDPQKGYYVHTFLTTQPTLNANATIPQNTGSIPIKLYTDTTVQHIVAGVDKLQIACSGIIYGKNSTVIWASHDWGSGQAGPTPELITIGIGWVKAQP
ncbi:MAG: hypothetical protein QXD70_04890 [Candidatus Bathyarchaeia archaeon]